MNRAVAIIIEINNKSNERKKGKWKNFLDTGEEFINRDHDYSYDLDIFGENSLFQYINTAKTFFGRIKMKNILSTQNIQCFQLPI